MTVSNDRSTARILRVAAIATLVTFSGLAAPTIAQAKQCGSASWYGPGFHGRTTANGERFDQNQMTAAHKRLPFGSKIRVTNQLNGKSLTLRVNDRGPFAKGRILDASAAAAKKLGFMRRGHAPVCVSIVG